MAWVGRESPGINNHKNGCVLALVSDLPLDGSLLHDASHMVGSLKATLTRANYLDRRVFKHEILPC